MDKKSQSSKMKEGPSKDSARRNEKSSQRDETSSKRRSTLSAVSQGTLLSKGKRDISLSPATRGRSSPSPLQERGSSLRHNKSSLSLPKKGGNSSPIRMRSHSSPSPVRKTRSSPHVTSRQSTFPTSTKKNLPPSGWKPIGRSSPSPDVWQSTGKPTDDDDEAQLAVRKDAKGSISPVKRGKVISPPMAYNKCHREKDRSLSGANQERRECSPPYAMQKSPHSKLQKRERVRTPSSESQIPRRKRSPSPAGRKVRRSSSFDDQGGNKLTSSELIGIREGESAEGKRRSPMTDMKSTKSPKFLHSGIDRRSRSPEMRMKPDAYRHQPKRVERSLSPKTGRSSASDGYRNRQSPASESRKIISGSNMQSRNERRGPVLEVKRARRSRSHDMEKRAPSPRFERENRSPDPGARNYRKSSSPKARTNEKVNESKRAHRTPSPKFTRDKRFPSADARNGHPTSPKRNAGRDEIQMKLLSMAGIPAADQKLTSITKRPPISRGRGGYETGGGREGRGGYVEERGGGGNNANLEPLARRSPVRREGGREKGVKQDKAGAEVDPTFLQFLKGEQWMNRPPPPVPGMRGGGRRSRSRSMEGSPKNTGSWRKRSRSYESKGDGLDRRYSPKETEHFSSPPSKRRKVIMGENAGGGLGGKMEDGEITTSKQDKKPRKEKKDKKRKKKKKKVSSSSDSDSDSSDEEAKKKKKKVKKDKKRKKKKPIEDCEAELRASIAEVEEERRRREEERKKKAPMTKEEWEKKQVNCYPTFLHHLDMVVQNVSFSRL